MPKIRNAPKWPNSIIDRTVSQSVSHSIIDPVSASVVNLTPEYKTKLKNKLKLWLVLHGYKASIKDLELVDYCHICSNRGRNFCNIDRRNRIGINEETEEIRLLGPETANSFSEYYCIEWVKYV